MEKMLYRLLEVDGVLAGLLLSQDGLAVASANLEEDEADLIGALATAMVASMRATTDRLAVGNLRAARLTTDSGVLDIYLVHDLILLLLCEAQVDQPTLEGLLEEAMSEWLELAV